MTTLRLLGLVCLALALTSCSAYYIDETAPSLSAPMVEGRWIHEGPDGLVASITLNTDGTFSATDIPTLSQPEIADIQSGAVEDDTQVDWAALLYGHGIWSIKADHGGSAPGVDLHFEADVDSPLPQLTAGSRSGDYARLLSLGTADSFQLFMTVGDADAKYRFTFTRAE